MDQMIIALACMVVNKEYATLLASDLKDYSEKEKRAQGKRLSLAQRQWLLADTTC